MGLTGIRRTPVVRSRQLLPQDPFESGRLPRLKIGRINRVYCNSQLRSISDYTAPPDCQGHGSIPAVNTNNLECRRKPNEVEFTSPQSAFMGYSFSSGVCAYS